MSSPLDLVIRHADVVTASERFSCDIGIRDGHVAPHVHAHARAPVVEREATHRAIAFAELVDVPMLIVHMSGADAIEQIRWARGRGGAARGSLRKRVRNICI